MISISFANRITHSPEIDENNTAKLVDNKHVAGKLCRVFSTVKWEATTAKTAPIFHCLAEQNPQLKRINLRNS